jgi:predicted nucleic acid-binding protein
MSVGAADATVAALNSGRWRRVTTGPDPSLLRSLALRSQLRGADLWHLALAATLRVDLLELRLLTFDARMQRAAVSEGVSI